jgi:hypothetical protein
MISTFLWSFSILVFYSMASLITILFSQLENSISLESVKCDDLNFKENTIRLLNKIFNFQKMIDSQLIGLIVFLNSIILTEIINANIDTKNASSFKSLVILVSYSLVSVGSGFMVFTIFKFFKGKSSDNETVQRE